MTRMRAMTMGGALLATTALLAACGGGDSTSEPAASAPGAASMAASAPAASAEPSGLVGGDPSTWSPVQVTMDMNGQVIDLVVGQAVLFPDLPEVENLNIETSDPAVIEAFLPTDDGTMQTAAGLRAVGVGASHVILVDGFPADGPAEPIAQFVFQVTEQQGEGNGGPMVVDATTTSVDLFPGQWLVLADMPEGTVVETSDDMVIWWAAQESAAGDPSLIAVGEGTATVVAKDADGKELANLAVTVTRTS